MTEVFLVCHYYWDDDDDHYDHCVLSVWTNKEYAEKELERLRGFPGAPALGIEVFDTDVAFTDTTNGHKLSYD